MSDHPYGSRPEQVRDDRGPEPTPSGVAGRAQDPQAARDIAQFIDSRVTDPGGIPVRDLALADVARRTPDVQVAGDVGHDITDDRLRMSVLTEVAEHDPRAR